MIVGYTVGISHNNIHQYYNSNTVIHQWFFLEMTFFFRRIDLIGGGPGIELGDVSFDDIGDVSTGKIGILNLAEG